MKKLSIVAALLLIVGIAMGVAEEAEARPWAAGVVIGGGSGDGEGMASLGVTVTREVSQWLDLGLSLAAFSKTGEHPEDELGRSYHLESGYGALLLRPKLAVTEWMELALPIESGSGTLLYRYDREYAEELRWTEETIDALTYAYYSIGLESRFFLGARYVATLSGGYQGTSPLRTDLAEKDELTGPWGRVGIAYRF
mgnify:CR=1 FL=1